MTTRGSDVDEDGRVAKLVAELTLEEKCALTGGRDIWSTQPVERLGIPSVRVTDGPNGARGPIAPGEGTMTSACVPCGSALGATWDPALVEEVGRVLGQEARSKASRVLLAPTVNIHRSPLGGRDFECYSEDPLLSGKVAAAFVRGAQSEGVACTVKHFAGNDAEFERNTISSEIDERTLREIYLTPFELAVKEGGALGVMTGYNRLNGTWCAEHAELLRDILRGEWGFEGFVISDWWAVGSSAGSTRAGLDLEMPGPVFFYGRHLVDAVRSGEVDEADVDACVTRLLGVFDRIGALDDPPAEPQSIDRPEHREVARRAAASAMVLLRNDGILPLDASSLSRIAVIGPNAEPGSLMGGGSANFRPHHRTSPLDAIRERFPSAEVRYEPGTVAAGPPPVLRIPFAVSIYEGADAADGDAAPVTELVVPDTQVFFLMQVPGIGRRGYRITGSGQFSIDRAGTYTFGLSQAAGTVVRVDGAVVLDGVANPARPGGFLGMSEPLTVDVELDAGSHELVVDCSTDRMGLAAGFVVGCRLAAGDDGLERAAAAAADADVAVVVVGTDATWESEGHDRPHMGLPGGQDELVERVLAANPNTVVVLNTGAPVALPWAERAPALLQGWFGGQELGPALVDVLVGDRDPGGRLPTTFPIRVEHNPSFGSFPGENGVLRYGEGVFVGYRWYDARHLPVRFPFGHGLSYSTWSIGAPVLSAGEVVDGEELSVTVTVPVTNTGSRRASEVVQCYVAPPEGGGHPRPPQELRAFAKVELEPGETTEVELELGRRAFARWDPANPDLGRLTERLAGFPMVQVPPHPSASGWVVDPGTYEIGIGRSSADVAHRIPLEIRAAG